MIALPAHAPCGIDGGGDVDPATGMATCTAVRGPAEFKRCGCKRDPKKPTRGAETCTSCKEVGFTVAVTLPGCGTTFGVCGRCGLRAVVNAAPCSACNPGASSAEEVAA